MGKSPLRACKGCGGVRVKHADDNPATQTAEQTCVWGFNLLLLLDTVPQQKQLGETL